MRVFHGSDMRIEKIDLTKGKEHTDFGKGFYVTNIRGHAHQRAVNIAIEKNTKPVVTEFEYIEAYPVNTGLSVMRFDKPSEEWVNFVIMNRDETIVQPAHSYDIVEGPIANDWVTYQIKRYKKSKINLEQLIKKLLYREQTHQICFCTPESLLALRLMEDDSQFDIEDLCSLMIENLETDYQMTQLEAVSRLYRSNVFAKLSDKESFLYEKTWQEIYQMLKIEILNK